MPDQPQAPDPHEFIFELDRAIKDQVLQKLDTSPKMPLARDCAPRKSGVYALYQNSTVVYIGKASRESTESERDLRGRLNEHVSKISGRKNLSLAEMTCRFLTIESDWFVWAAERALITTFSPTWNASGFGNKDYGKGRDKQAPSVFDNGFPIDEGFSCDSMEAGQVSIHELLCKMKDALPYVFRYQTKGNIGGISVKDYYKTRSVTVAASTPTAEQMLRIIVNGLGKGWQGTIFKSHMILYYDNEKYGHAVKIIRSK